MRWPATGGARRTPSPLATPRPAGVALRREVRTLASRDGGPGLDERMRRERARERVTAALQAALAAA